MPAHPQHRLRLWWVAAYHSTKRIEVKYPNGRHPDTNELGPHYVDQPVVIYESEQPGRVSTEQIDRKDLKRFWLVDQDGTEVFGLGFPEGTDDPKLIYRRRSFPGKELPPLGDDEHRPPWMLWQWSYIVGQHHSDGTLRLWTMNPETFEFEEDAAEDVELVACEVF